MIFPILQMYRASEAFKTEVLKNTYKKIWSRNSNLKVKGKYNVNLENSKFELLAIMVIQVEKNANFFISYQKIALVSLLENIPYLIFVFQTLVEICPFITSCFWGPARWSYCNDHKNASDSLSTYQALSKFWVRKKICDDPTASTRYTVLCTSSTYIVRCGRVMADNIAYAKFRKNLLIW